MKVNYNEIVSIMIVIALSYLFLSFCNWEIWFGNWNGFSRFIFGVISLGVLLIKLKL